MTETQIQTDRDKFIKKGKIPPTPPPPYESPPPLTDEEIRKIYEEQKNNFMITLITAIVTNKPKLDAATENANDKNEQIIRDIINPTPDLFVDDNLNFENQTFRNNNSDKTYTLPKQLNKRLDDILKKNRPPEIFEPKLVEKIPNNPINIQESDDIFINDDTVIQDVPMFEPQIDFPQPSANTRDDFKIYPDKEDAIVFKSPSLTDVNTKKSRFVSYRITREQIRHALSTAFHDLQTIDYNNDTNVEDLIK